MTGFAASNTSEQWHFNLKLEKWTWSYAYTILLVHHDFISPILSAEAQLLPNRYNTVRGAGGDQAQMPTASWKTNGQAKRDTGLSSINEKHQQFSTVHLGFLDTACTQKLRSGPNQMMGCAPTCRPHRWCPPYVNWWRADAPPLSYWTHHAPRWNGPMTSENQRWVHARTLTVKIYSINA